MWLLNSSTLELESFSDVKRPRYVILSHTWESQEILFEDARRGRRKLLSSKKKGLEKVKRSAAMALAHGYSHIWIDTCCIDKSSSAELSEAINSMFAWYGAAERCYAYLADYNSAPDSLSAGTSKGNSTRHKEGHSEKDTNNSSENTPSTASHVRISLGKSRWFTRGWTLQELIAPRKVDFYDQHWRLFGDRASLAPTLSRITHVDERVLRWHVYWDCPVRWGASDPPWLSFDPRCPACYTGVEPLLEVFSVAVRMAWASHRETTRPEDRAYSLLGLFDVHMPLLYGEGGSNAFRRLQLEVVRRWPDQSILAWRSAPSDYFVRQSQIFAPSPQYFAGTEAEAPLSNLRHGYRLLPSGDGLELEAHVAPCSIQWADDMFADEQMDKWVAVLDCAVGGDPTCCVAVVLVPTLGTTGGQRQFQRFSISGHEVISFRFPKDGKSTVRWRPEANPVPKLAGLDLGVSFDPTQLQRETILLRPDPGDGRPFVAPPSRVDIICTADAPIYSQVSQFSPSRLVRDPNDALTYSTSARLVICEALCFASRESHGFIVVWGVWEVVDRGTNYKANWWLDSNRPPLRILSRIYPIYGREAEQEMIESTSDEHRFKKLISRSRTLDMVDMQAGSEEVRGEGGSMCWWAVGAEGLQLSVEAKVRVAAFMDRKVVEVLVEVTQGMRPAGPDGDT